MKFTLSLKCTYLQEIIRAVVVVLDVKVVKYQHNFAPCWHYDFIPSVVIIAVVFGIVGRNNGANYVSENLLVCTDNCRQIYNER